MRFLVRLGFRNAFQQTLEHKRANNARYQRSDAVELNLLRLIAGARSVDESIKLCGMTHVRTSPFYPQSNAKLERFHATLKLVAYIKQAFVQFPLNQHSIIPEDFIG